MWLQVEVSIGEIYDRNMMSWQKYHDLFFVFWGVFIVVEVDFFRFSVWYGQIFALVSPVPSDNGIHIFLLGTYGDPTIL